MGIRYKFTMEQINEMIDLYINKLYSIKEISNKFGCDSSVIQRHLKQANIKLISGSPFSKKYWVSRGMTENDAIIKIKQMKPIYVEYWINKGYSVDDAKLQIELHLMNTKRAFVIKYGDVEGNKKWAETKEKQGKYNSKRSIDYWLIRGFDLIEANNKLKEYQQTFSLQKCIDKYGEVEGRKKWQNRQIKWQNTLQNLNNIDDINKRKDSSSIIYFKTKYKENWPIEYLIRYKNESFRELLTNIFNFCKNKKDIVTYFVINVKYDIKKINQFVNNKFIIEIFKINPAELRQEILNGYDITLIKTFGIQRTIKGYLAHSIGEYEIINFLIDSNIPFNFDKNYPKQKFKTGIRYDFYLPDLDMYFEYAGMLNMGNSLKPSNNKIKEDYEKKIKEKIKFCQQNQLNCYVSNDYNEIINTIKQKYEEKNNTRTGL